MSYVHFCANSIKLRKWYEVDLLACMEALPLVIVSCMCIEVVKTANG